MYSDIVIKGVNLLKNEKNYNQTELIDKLRHLDFEVSTSTFSNIINGTKKVSDKMLFNVSQGIQKIIALELGLHWEDGKFVKKEDQFDWIPVEVPGLSVNAPSIIAKPGFAYHEEGRLSTQQKVDFFASAQKEVIEFGITLNTFISYFVSRRDSEYKSPVEQLLEKGVHFKCYLLDPDGNEARLYFDDRKRSLGEEAKGPEKIKASIQQLIKLKNDFITAGYQGVLDIFTYKHIPYNYFMAVDGAKPYGKMMVSHYIYGMPRAKCPVIEFNKSSNRSLFKRYWASLQLLTQDSKKVG